VEKTREATREKLTDNYLLTIPTGKLTSFLPNDSAEELLKPLLEEEEKIGFFVMEEYHLILKLYQSIVSKPHETYQQIKSLEKSIEEKDELIDKLKEQIQEYENKTLINNSNSNQVEKKYSQLKAVLETLLNEEENKSIISLESIEARRLVLGSSTIRRNSVSSISVSSIDSRKSGNSIHSIIEERKELIVKNNHINSSLEKLKEINKELELQLGTYQKLKLHSENKEKELTNLKNFYLLKFGINLIKRNKVQSLIEVLCESEAEFIKAKSSFARKQKERTIENLLRKSLTQSQIDNLLSLQSDISQTEIQLQEIVDYQEKELKKHAREGDFPIRILDNLTSYDVMISYSHSDCDCANLILDSLQNAGLKV
jgi:hypothetical protein